MSTSIHSRNLCFSTIFIIDSTSFCFTTMSQKTILGIHSENIVRLMEQPRFCTYAAYAHERAINEKTKNHRYVTPYIALR
jgi:hypothetical protein